MMRAILSVLWVLPLAANYEETATAQAQANAKPGVRTVAERVIPVPTEGVSPQVQTLIAGPYVPIFNNHPKNNEEWKAFVAPTNQAWLKQAEDFIAKLPVKITRTTIAGVNAYIVEPLKISEKNKNRLLVYVHGGGYVLGSGESGIGEAILMAGIGGYKIISIDYRMPPDFPYPAALDDAIAVWKEVVTMTDPKNIGLFGTSTGGGMTLAIVLRARDEHLPLPAAIATGTPWSDLTDIGDSYKTNEWVDNVLVTWNGWLGDAAKLYANGRDLKEPYLSPIYGDFHGFPPAILTTGTRDLFLSNTVRAHRKLRRAGVEAELNVYEGMSHGQFLGDPSIPEVQEVMLDISRFFDRNLG
jgi:monoterpene epsilon-lactone hydrolase